MFQLIYVVTHWLVETLQPILVPLCFVLAWTLIALVIWSIWSAMRDTIARAKQMHQIPCANCRFFTSNYYLKCPVHPTSALSDAAINCPDYEPTPYLAAIQRHEEQIGD